MTFTAPTTFEELVEKHGLRQAKWLWDPRKQREAREMEEEIIATAGSGTSIPPHPEGQFAATCIDIVDLGMVETTWQGQTRSKHRIYLRFFCGEEFRDGENMLRPLWIDHYMTLSLHENSAMRPFLEKWRGQKFKDSELGGFNVAVLLGVPAYIQVSHNATANKTYANIDSIMKLPKGQTAPEAPAGYVRVKDRPPREENGGGPVPDGESARPGWVDEEDDLPF